MARAIWKGAISFGLVHVPVALYAATTDSGIDFDWIDRRSMDPVGYRRINKRTGKEVGKDDIVRGIKVANGRYVIMHDDEIRAAYPRTTQSIEIEGFVKPEQIAFTLLERPYYLEPTGRSDRVYALLRETLHQAGVVGLARLVMHNKEHLATLVAVGPLLLLNTLRWPADVRPWSDLKLPAPGRSALKDAELKMAAALVQNMALDWKPDDAHDRFGAAIDALVAQRIKAGKARTVEPMEEAPPAAATNVVDLSELLARSLKGRPAAQKRPRRSTPDRRAAARQRAGAATR